jgi:heme/copper-type cytochrome/quinol oxidase subunit 2
MEMQTMSHGLSNFSGAVAAWLCLAPVAFAREPLSFSSTLASAPTSIHYIANLSLFLIWSTAGIVLVVGGLLTFAPFKFRGRKLNPLSEPAQVSRRIELDLAWTMIPVLLAILLLAATWINFAIQSVSKPTLHTLPARIVRADAC